MAARMIFFYHRALRLMSSSPHLRIVLRTPRFTRRRGGCIRWKLFRRPSASPSLSSPKSLLSQQTANLRKSQSRSRWRPPRHPPPPFPLSFLPQKVGRRCAPRILPPPAPTPHSPRTKSPETSFSPLPSEIFAIAKFFCIFLPSAPRPFVKAPFAA